MTASAPPSPTAASAPTAPKRANVAVVAIGFSILLVIGMLTSASLGQYGIPVEDVARSVLRAVGIQIGAPLDQTAEATLWSVRFPRVAMSALVGAALAAAGLAMQAVFANPLAEPGVIGISSGAAFGASAAIVFGWTFLGAWTVPTIAFLAALASTILVYATARSGGRTEVVTLVLTGVAVTAVSGAGIALMTFLGDQASREQIVFWQLGSLNGTRWPEVGIVAVAVVVGIAVLSRSTGSFDLLSLGERQARHLGVRVEALRIVTILVVAVLAGFTVAFTGVIGFVGLVIPHLLRMAIGPAHGPLLLLSTLGGALLLVIADMVARNAVGYADLPIGMLTALVGGPFFFWLLRRTRRRAGGWG